VTDCYREAASILLLRPVTEGDWSSFEVFLIHKPRKKDAWQLPQGGKNPGETDEQCAIRELQEETGVVGATVLGVSPHKYQYDFPKSYRRFRPDNVCGQSIAYFIGTVPRDVHVQVDNVEVNDFKWVTPEEISTYVKRKEYLSLIHGLMDEARELLRS